MSIAAILRELIAAGISGDALVEAIERIEAAKAPKRSSAAVRQQRYRDRKADGDTVTRGVTSVTTVTNVTPAPSPLAGPPKKRSNPALIPQPPEINIGREALDFAAIAECVALFAADALAKPKAKPKTVARRLPIDWQPTPLAEEARSRWDADDLSRELERFRDHWAASGGANARKHDWQAAWRNWIRGAEDKKPKDQRNGNATRLAATGVHQPQYRRDPAWEGLKRLYAELD